MTTALRPPEQPLPDHGGLARVLTAARRERRQGQQGWLWLRDRSHSGARLEGCPWVAVGSAGLDSCSTGRRRQTLGTRVLPPPSGAAASPRPDRSLSHRDLVRAAGLAGRGAVSTSLEFWLQPSCDLAQHGELLSLGSPRSGQGRAVAGEARRAGHTRWQLPSSSPCRCCGRSHPPLSSPTRSAPCPPDDVTVHLWSQAKPSRPPRPAWLLAAHCVVAGGVAELSPGGQRFMGLGEKQVGFLKFWRHSFLSEGCTKTPGGGKSTGGDVLAPGSGHTGRWVRVGEGGRWTGPSEGSVRSQPLRGHGVGGRGDLRVQQSHGRLHVPSRAWHYGCPPAL